MIKTKFIAVAVVMAFAGQALAQAVQEIKGTVVQIEQSEKEAMVQIDSRENMLLIKNLLKFTAGELSLLKSSLENAVPVKIKTQGNEIIAISK